MKIFGRDLSNYPMLKILNEIWVSLVFLVDHFYNYTDRIIDRKYQRLDGVIKLKILVFKRQKIIFQREFE